MELEKRIDGTGNTVRMVVAEINSRISQGLPSHTSSEQAAVEEKWSYSIATPRNIQSTSIECTYQLSQPRDGTIDYETNKSLF